MNAARARVPSASRRGTLARAEGGGSPPPGRPRRPRMRILSEEEREKRAAERQQQQQEQAPVVVAGVGETEPAEPVKVYKVEDEGVEVEGIARVDRGEETFPSLNNAGSTAALVAGDAIALLAFAAIGRASHGESLGAGDLFATALPFMIGWFGAGYFVSAYNNSARGKNGANQSLEPAFKTWALGIPAGIALRTVGKGYLPPKAFVVATVLTTLVLMVGWRFGYATYAEPKEFKRRGNTKGNPLEFLDMIFGLIKRW